MIITETKNKQLIKEFITNPILWNITGYVGNSDEFIPDLNHQYLLATKDDKKVCLMELKKFTNLVSEAHIYTLPEEMRKGIGSEAVKVAIEWIKENTKIKTIMLTVPLSCEHVIKFLTKTEFKVCGMLHKSIVYQNQLQDLVLYELGV